MDQVLTCKDVATLLKLTPDTVRYHERRGALPAERTVSGMRLFKRADVDAFAAKREAR